MKPSSRPQPSGQSRSMSEQNRIAYNEAQLWAILQTSVEGIITIDEKGIIESFNAAAERIFGYRSRDVIGKNVRMLMPAAEGRRHDEYIANYLRHGEKKIIGIGRDVLGLRKDGAVFPLHLSVSEVRYNNQRIFTGFVHDLSQQRMAEERATRLGRIVEDSTNEVYVFDAESLKFTMVNRLGREHVGYTAEELSQLTPLDLIPDFNLDSLEALLRPLRDATSERIHLETVHRRKDGTLYPVDVHLQLARAERTPCFIAIVLDISDRLDYEAKLRQERDFAESLVETAHAVVLVLDPQGRIVRFNRFLEQLSGYRIKDVQGQDWFETFLPSRDRNRLRKVFITSMSGEGVSGFVNPIVTADGEEREISWWDRRLRDSQGRVIGILAIGHDVTDLRQAQERVVQSERLAAIGEAMAGLAHESRNALQRIQVCTEMLEDCVPHDADAMEYVKVIQKAQEDLQRTYQEVREYAAPIALSFEPLTIDKLMRDVWNELASDRSGRAVEFVEHRHCDDLACEADPFALGRVFRNILENALAACQDPVRIHVRYARCASGDGDALRVSVRDNGPGLHRELRERVFESFYTTKTKGTGLGLAICKRIVQSHGGQVFASEHVEEGAEFVVELPRRQL